MSHQGWIQGGMGGMHPPPTGPKITKGIAHISRISCRKLVQNVENHALSPPTENFWIHPCIRFIIMERFLYQKSTRAPPLVGGDKVRFSTFWTHFQQIMHEVWAVPIVIVGPMVQLLLTHWILETKQQQKPNQ